EDRPEPLVPDSPPEPPEDLTRQLEAEHAALERLEEEVASMRKALGQTSTRARRLRERLAAAEQMLHARRRSLQTLAEQIATTGEDIKRTRRTLAELAAQRTELARAVAELHVAVAERQEALKRQRTRFRIVAFDGSRGTTRRPIVLECGRDAIRFVPEGLGLGPEQLNGFTVRFNPLAQGVKALAAFWEAWYESHPEPGVDPEPYVLLIVRPSGTVAFYVAQRLLAPTGIPFGYQLVEEGVELDVGPANPEAVQALREAVEPALSQREKLVAVLARRSRAFGEPLDLGDAQRGFLVANPKLAGRDGAAGGTARGNRTGPDAGRPAASGTGRPGDGPADGHAVHGRGGARPPVPGIATRARSGGLRPDATWSRFPRRYGVTPADRFFTSDAFRNRHVGDERIGLSGRAAGGPPRAAGRPDPHAGRGSGARGEGRAGWPEAASGGAERSSTADGAAGWPRLEQALKDPASRAEAGAVSRRTAVPSGRGAIDSLSPDAESPARPSAANASGSSAATAADARDAPAGSAVPLHRRDVAGVSDVAASVGGEGNEGGSALEAATAARQRLAGRSTVDGPVRSGLSAPGGLPNTNSAAAGTAGSSGTAAMKGSSATASAVAALPSAAGAGRSTADGSAGFRVGGSGGAAPESLRRWGIHSPDAVIGLERPVPLCVDADAVTVGGRTVRRFDPPDDPTAWTTFLAGLVQQTATDWGPPPRVFYWVPRLQVTVVPGGQVHFERLRKAAERLRLDVDANPQLAPPDWAVPQDDSGAGGGRSAAATDVRPLEGFGGGLGP
ncbi:MAG: hypothetical protein D6725_14870, partial [Planctomycetota bacterium]